MQQNRETLGSPGIPNSSDNSRGSMLEHLKRHAIRADAFFLVPGFLLLVAEGALIVWDVFRREGGDDALQTFGPVGLLLVVAGLGFTLGGALTLRSNYSATLVIRKSHELVVHGIYRFVRLPIYLGAILVTLGGPIGTSSWIALPPMLLLVRGGYRGVLRTAWGGRSERRHVRAQNQGSVGLPVQSLEPQTERPL